MIFDGRGSISLFWKWQLIKIYSFHLHPKIYYYLPESEFQSFDWNVDIPSKYYQYFFSSYDLVQKFYPRDLLALSASPLLAFPTHFVGDVGYVSDTDNSTTIAGEDGMKYRNAVNKIEYGLDPWETLCVPSCWNQCQECHQLMQQHSNVVVMITGCYFALLPRPD